MFNVVIYLMITSITTVGEKKNSVSCSDICLHMLLFSRKTLMLRLTLKLLCVESGEFCKLSNALVYWNNCRFPLFL